MNSLKIPDTSSVAANYLCFYSVGTSTSRDQNEVCLGQIPKLIVEICSRFEFKRFDPLLEILRFVDRIIFHNSQMYDRLLLIPLFVDVTNLPLWLQKPQYVSNLQYYVTLLHS